MYINNHFAVHLKLTHIVNQLLFLLCCVLSVQLFVTPRTVACQAPLTKAFSKQEYWSRLPFPPPAHLPDTGNEPVSLGFPALAGGFFTTEPPGNPINHRYFNIK